MPGKPMLGSPTFKTQLVDRILERQDATGCWNVLPPENPYPPEWNYYIPNYSSTLWTLILAADLAAAHRQEQFHKPLQTISDHFFDPTKGIYSIGRSHFPIPCLNGNMLYLHGYFEAGNPERIDSVIAFFDRYQRFDDGDWPTPSTYPYLSNKSCYGKHSCYWGIVKLLKGLSFMPAPKRSAAAKRLLAACIDFILRHQVCYSSRQPDSFISKSIEKLSFPNLYKADFLEILWLLKRENIRSPAMNRAIGLLNTKSNQAGAWELERPTAKLVIPLGKRPYGHSLVSERARQVLDWYGGSRGQPG